jgi:hypothetical protein
MIVNAQVRTSDHRGWSFVQPCLTTGETTVLADWLASVGCGWVEPSPVAAAATVQPSFPRGGERAGLFGNKPVEMVAGDPGEDTMGQGRTGRLDRHKSATVRPAAVQDQADTPGYINTPLLIPGSLGGNAGFSRDLTGTTVTA